MTEPLHKERALRFLLDDFSADEAAAFRKALEEDALLKDEIKQLGDDLRDWSGGHCAEIAPSKRVWTAINRELSAPAATSRKTGLTIRFSSALFWRAAAIILLIANFGWLAHWLAFRNQPIEPHPTTTRSRDTHAIDPGAARVASSNDSAESVLDPATKDPATLDLSLREKEIRILELREALVASNRTARLAQQDRDHLAARLNTFFQPQEGRSQLTLIEMRPDGAERLNIVDDVHLALLDDGSVENPTEPAPDVVGADQNLDRLDDVFLTDEAGFLAGAPAPPPSEVTDPSPEAGLAESEPDTVEAGSNEEETATDAGTADSAALAIWRDDLQKGFVNLYGLPNPAEGSHYTLWTRSSDGAEYIPVGVLPNPDNGVLLIDFTVEESDFHPSDILVTEETVEGPTEPSKKIVLHGP